MARDFSSYLIVLIAIIFLILLWKAVTLLFSKSQIPGPRGNWLFGQLFLLKESKDLMQTFAEWENIYGPIVEFRPLGVFDKTYYLISDADALKQILVSKSFKYYRPVDAEGAFLFPQKNVFLANGKHHSRMKKMINPAFKVNNLKSMVDIFDKKAKLLAKYWNGIISAKSDTNKDCHLFVQNDLTRMALDALSECVFGYDSNTIEAGDTIISRALFDLFTGVTGAKKSFLLKLRLWFPFLKCFMKSITKREEAYKVISCVIRQIINDKRERKSDVSTEKKDLLDLLLEAVDEETGQGMDEEELFGQVFTFLFAGHETSSVALSWILYYLAQYPDIQEKVRQEVKRTLAEQEGSWETYESMNYLTAVINESLRLRPPGAVFRREVNQDDNILGYNIPAKSVIIIPPYVIHRKPEYWLDPETFNPARFLEPNSPDNRYTFLPFSIGPRICVGYRFALMEIKVVLATLLREFSFSMIPGMSFASSLSITYKPKPNLELLVRKVSE